MNLSDHEKQDEKKSLGAKIWNKAIHGRMIYLVFFNIGASITLIISGFFSGPTLITIKIVEICLLAVAVILKSTAVAKILNLKQLIKTQSQFIIPYLFTVVNIYLVVMVCVYLNEYNLSNSAFNIQFAIIESFRFLFMTYMCSMITNKKTTSKCEYWWYSIIIIIVVCFDIYDIVLKIKNYGAMLDDMGDQQTDNLIGYINKTITQETYESVKNSIGNQQTAIQNASNLDIACIASVVANYLVMMDAIARPIQKIEEKHHILKEFHSTLKGSSPKEEIHQPFLPVNQGINFSSNETESQRTQSQRLRFVKNQQETQPNQQQGKRKTILELQPRKSNL